MSDQAVQTKKYENHILRWFTAVLIMFVVYIHYGPTVKVGEYEVTDYVLAVGRFAMPVFFMISGYFMFSDDGHAERSVGKKAKRIFILIVFLKFFYLVFDLILWAFNIKNGDHILYDFFVFGDSTAHYWFVAALLTVYLIHWIMNRYHIDYKYLLPIGIILVLIDIIVGVILPAFGIGTIFGMKIGDFVAGWYVTISVFFFQVGYYIHKHKDWVDRTFSTRNLIIIAALSMAFNIFETMACLATGFYNGTAAATPTMNFGTVIFSAAFFILTFRAGEDMFRCRPLEWISRNASSWMYVYVGFAVIMMKDIFLTPWINDEFVYQVIGPFLAIGLDILSGVVMYLILMQLFGKKKHKKKTPQ